MFSIRLAHAEQLQGDIGRVAVELIDALDDADAAADRIRAAWDGEAATAHADVDEEWRADARRMVAACEELRQVLQAAHGNYAAAASANRTMWG